jgi:polar amino acid transport system substrate-binding protein
MRIKGIVDDLKDFSRPQGDSDAGGFDLGTVVEKASRLLHNQIKKSTDNYIVDIANDMPLTLGQSQRIEQVVLNLIQNACLALDDRSASVQVRVYFDVDKIKNVVEVKDQGRGIEAKDLKHIQEPFFTTRREDGGSGLGLSVSSRIINDHNGLLDIESKPGEGSLFRVLLPIIES